MIRRIASIILAAVLILGALSILPADTKAVSGSCGSAITWEYNGGILTLTGSGDMTDYSADSPAPWAGYSNLITDVRISDGVTSIGDHAFAGCNSIRNITIPAAVTSIGDYAFCRCDSMPAVSIPSAVVSIGSYAFYGCGGLTEAVIPDSVTTIGESAFGCCSGLNTVTIGSGTASIGDYAFEGCGSLTAITVSAGNGSFTSVSGVLYNQDQTTLLRAPAAYSGSFTIPGTVTTVGASAFSGCAGLTGVTIPATVTTIQAYAFYGTGLTEVTIPSAVSGLGKEAFGKCAALTGIRVDGGNTKFCSDEKGVLYSKDMTTLHRVPATLSGSYVIPETVCLLADHAFDGCAALTAVTLSGGMTSIGESAFEGCSGLTAITIPENVAAISSYAFYGCTALTEVTILAAVIAIGREAFGECASLTRVRFVGSAPSFGVNAFYGVTATAEYPQYVTGWDSDDRQSYGGTISWVTYHEHSYTEVSFDTTCQEYARVEYECEACGDSYTVYAEGLMSDWVETLPTGIDESLVERKTQYRSSDYETTTSYETALDGYSLLTSEWEKSGSGTINYVNSWPSGFSTSSSVYATYNKKSTKKTASETETAKTEINSDALVGYLWYHWCYTDSYYSAESSSDSYTTFHAFYSTTAPGDCTKYDDSDNSYYNPNTSCCSNSDWFWHVEVYAQAYTTYQKLFTYERWTDFTDWSETPVAATDTRMVETRTLYRYVDAPLGDHAWKDGVCTVCAESCTHTYENGVCAVCGMSEPVVVPTMSFVGASLRLTGDIGLNFYVKLDENLQADPETRMTFTYSGKTQTVYFADAEATVQNGIACYMFTCKLWAVDMADTVTAQLYNANGTVGPTKDYGVKMYCDAVFSYIENYPGYAASFERAAPLLKAMLNYGAAAQAVFTGDTAEQMANAGLSAADKILVTDYDYSGYAHSVIGSEDGIAASGASLLLDSTTTIRYYFTLTGSKTVDAYTFVVNGKEVEPVLVSGRTYSVDLVGITANNLDTLYTATVGGLSICYGALSYVRQVKLSSTDAKMIAMVDALYAYSMAANDYFV